MPAAKKKCFVVCPLGEVGSPTRRRSDQVLRFIIEPAAAECGYQTTRSDLMPQPGLITNQIIEHVLNDDLVIADLTDRNPNVFYELALRHAVRKPFIQIVQAGEDLPFDIAHTRTIAFNHCDLDSADWARRQIVEQMRVLADEPGRVDSPIALTLDILAIRNSNDPQASSLADAISLLAELCARLERLERAVRHNQSRPQAA